MAEGSRSTRRTIFAAYSRLNSNNGSFGSTAGSGCSAGGNGGANSTKPATSLREDRGSHIAQRLPIRSDKSRFLCASSFDPSALRRSENAHSITCVAHAEGLGNRSQINEDDSNSLSMSSLEASSAVDVATLLERDEAAHRTQYREQQHDVHLLDISHVTHKLRHRNINWPSHMMKDCCELNGRDEEITGHFRSTEIDTLSCPEREDGDRGEVGIDEASTRPITTDQTTNAKELRYLMKLTKGNTIWSSARMHHHDAASGRMKRSVKSHNGGDGATVGKKQCKSAVRYEIDATSMKSCEPFSANVQRDHMVEERANNTDERCVEIVIDLDGCERTLSLLHPNWTTEGTGTGWSADGRSEKAHGDTIQLGVVLASEQLLRLCRANRNNENLWIQLVALQEQVARDNGISLPNLVQRRQLEVLDAACRYAPAPALLILRRVLHLQQRNDSNDLFQSWSRLSRSLGNVKCGVDARRAFRRVARGLACGFVMSPDYSCNAARQFFTNILQECRKVSAFAIQDQETAAADKPSLPVNGYGAELLQAMLTDVVFGVWLPTEVLGGNQNFAAEISRGLVYLALHAWASGCSANASKLKTETLEEIKSLWVDWSDRPGKTHGASSTCGSSTNEPIAALASEVPATGQCYERVHRLVALLLHKRLDFDIQSLVGGSSHFEIGQRTRLGCRTTSDKSIGRGNETDVSARVYPAPSSKCKTDFAVYVAAEVGCDDLSWCCIDSSPLDSTESVLQGRIEAVIGAAKAADGASQCAAEVEMASKTAQESAAAAASSISNTAAHITLWETAQYAAEITEKAIVAFSTARDAGSNSAVLDLQALRPYCVHSDWTCGFGQRHLTETLPALCKMILNTEAHFALETLGSNSIASDGAGTCTVVLAVMDFLGAPTLHRFSSNAEPLYRAMIRDVDGCNIYDAVAMRFTSKPMRVGIPASKICGNAAAPFAFWWPCSSLGTLRNQEQVASCVAAMIQWAKLQLRLKRGIKGTSDSMEDATLDHKWIVQLIRSRGSRLWLASLLCIQALKVFPENSLLLYTILQLAPTTEIYRLLLKLNEGNPSLWLAFASSLFNRAMTVALLGADNSKYSTVVHGTENKMRTTDNDETQEKVKDSPSTLLLQARKVMKTCCGAFSLFIPLAASWVFLEISAGTVIADPCSQWLSTVSFAENTYSIAQACWVAKGKLMTRMRATVHAPEGASVSLAGTGGSGCVVCDESSESNSEEEALLLLPCQSRGIPTVAVEIACCAAEKNFANINLSCRKRRQQPAEAPNCSEGKLNSVSDSHNEFLRQRANDAKQTLLVRLNREGLSDADSFPLLTSSFWSCLLLIVVIDGWLEGSMESVWQTYLIHGARARKQFCSRCTADEDKKVSWKRTGNPKNTVKVEKSYWALDVEEDTSRSFEVFLCFLIVTLLAGSRREFFLASERGPRGDFEVMLLASHHALQFFPRNSFLIAIYTKALLWCNRLDDLYGAFENLLHAPHGCTNKSDEDLPCVCHPPSTVSTVYSADESSRLLTYLRILPCSFSIVAWEGAILSEFMKAEPCIQRINQYYEWAMSCTNQIFSWSCASIDGTRAHRVTMDNESRRRWWCPNGRRGRSVLIEREALFATMAHARLACRIVAQCKMDGASIGRMVEKLARYPLVLWHASLTDDSSCSDTAYPSDEKGSFQPSPSETRKNETAALPDGNRATVTNSMLATSLSEVEHDLLQGVTQCPFSKRLWLMLLHILLLRRGPADKSGTLNLADNEFLAVFEEMWQRGVGFNFDTLVAAASVS